MSDKSGQVRTRPRGFFAIGVFNPKTPANMGTLWRSAAALGAAYTFQIGGRFRPESTNTTKSWKTIPHFVYIDLDVFHESIPYAVIPVAVELTNDARPIKNYVHPEAAVYLLGAEDNGLPARALSMCRDTVILPGAQCLNVAVAGSILMYDRINKGMP